MSWKVRDASTYRRIIMYLTRPRVPAPQDCMSETDTGARKAHVVKHGDVAGGNSVEQRHLMRVLGSRRKSEKDHCHYLPFRPFPLTSGAASCPRQRAHTHTRAFTQARTHTHTLTHSRTHARTHSLAHTPKQTKHPTTRQALPRKRRSHTPRACYEHEWWASSMAVDCY